MCVCVCLRERETDRQTDRKRERFVTSSLSLSARGEARRDRRLEKKILALEDLLASKLAQFLDSCYSYSLSQLSSAAKTHLYKGPTGIATTASDSGSSASTFVSKDTKPHPLKGGWMIQDYLTYDWYVIRYF